MVLEQIEILEEEYPTGILPIMHDNAFHASSCRFFNTGV